MDGSEQVDNCDSKQKEMSKDGSGDEEDDAEEDELKGGEGHQTMISKNIRQKPTRIQGDESPQGDGSPSRLEMKRMSFEKTESDVAKMDEEEKEKVEEMVNQGRPKSGLQNPPTRKPEKQRNRCEKLNQILHQPRRKQCARDRPQELRNSQSTIMEQSKS